MAMIGLTPAQRALLDYLATGPRTPAELGQGTRLPFVAAELARLERRGLARMAGSNADGPWMLTDSGRP